MQIELRPVACEITDHLDFTARNSMNGSIGVAQDRASQGNVLNHALNICDPYRISDVVLVFREDEESVDEVFDKSLSTEANGEAGYPGACQQRSHICLLYTSDA